MVFSCCFYSGQPDGTLTNGERNQAPGNAALPSANGNQQDTGLPGLLAEVIVLDELEYLSLLEKKYLRSSSQMPLHLDRAMWTFGRPWQNQPI